MPSHITGATAGRRARSRAARRARWSRRRARRCGAVPTVAAVVSATASATPRGTRTAAERRADRSREREDGDDGRERELPPGSSSERGLSSSVTAAASRSACQRAAGRPASTATTPTAPMTPGALDRGAGAGQRHVEGDEGQNRQPPGDAPDPQEGSGTEGQGREQRHVLAAGRDQVRQTGRPEVLAQVVGQRVVLAEDHAAGERRRARGDGAGQRALGARSDRVDEPGGAAAAPAGRDDLLRAQLRVDAATREPGVVRRQAREAAPDLELGADRRARPRDPWPRAQEHAFVVDEDHCAAHAVRPPARRLEQRRRRAQGMAEERGQRAALDRRDARVPRPRAAQQRAEERGRERAATADRDRNGREHEQGDGPAPAEREPADHGRRGRVPWSRADSGQGGDPPGRRDPGHRDHAWTRSRRAASRFGPIPGT